ncbi:GMC family oxidoreductase, partial [Devosia sp.]
RRRVNLPHIRVAAHLAPTERSQRELSLANSRSYLMARYFHSVSESYITLKAIRQTIRNGERFGPQIKEAVGQTVAALPKLLLNVPQLTLALLDNRLNPDFVSRNFQIETIIEPVPNPESRVTLSDKRDRLGVPRVRVDWRLTEDDKRHFKVTHDLVTSELENSGAVMVTDKEEHVAARWPEMVQGCWHHMGTTRMHLDPKRGVVDADCRVHGMSNLFVAGSSVFPTGGSDTPTITIVALALRLAEKLQTALR